MRTTTIKYVGVCLHFENIQRISDGTTLPQMLLELERGLERAASVDVILGELRQTLQPLATILSLWKILNGYPLLSN